MAVDISQAPYYDDYDPSKKYNQLLAVPGRVEQARDFTQAQTVIYDFLQRLSDTLFKNGSLISGMGWTLKTSTILVDDGKVYMNGKIHVFNSQEIPITKVGLEAVGVKAIDSIITESDDSSLLDPTTSTGNLGQPGTHRLKTDISLVLNDPDASVIYTFQDGVLVSEVPKPQFDGLAKMLAQRTYDESGNFRVSGLELICAPYDANNIQLTVNAGSAYVKGYQVIKSVPTKLMVPLAKDSKSIIAEPKVYISGTTDYKLNNLPVKSISRVTAYIQTTQTVTRSSTPGGTDPLANTPVVDIESIVAGATTYVKGTDYQLTSDGVDWSLGGAEPTSGTSYTVTYEYNKVLTPSTDYTQYSVIGNYGETVDYVRFTASGLKPANSSTFFVDYDFYLPRVDLVYLGSDGNVQIVTGQSDIASNVKPPIVGTDTFTLGLLHFPANSGNATPTFNAITRLDMGQLQGMLSRVKDLEFNQAISTLDREAIEGEVATDLRGIFSDSFRTIDRADMTNPSFNIMLDLDTGSIRLPLDNVIANKPVVSSTGSVRTWQNVTTIPILSEQVVISQPYATTSMMVNPYLVFNTQGALSLTPQSDNWVDDSVIYINQNAFAARKFYRYWRHGLDSVLYLLKDFDLFDQSLLTGGSVISWRPAIGDTGVAVKTQSSTSVLDQAADYMRQISITINASNLIPSSDNLTCYFDGTKVNLTPISPSTAGTTIGTIKADTSGNAKATFTIPSGIRTGTREVTLSNANNLGSTTFTSNGISRTTTITTTTTFTTLTAVDPLAQTFQFSEDTTLTSVGVYFSGKDSTNNVICQIRDVVNGYPGTTVYTQKVIPASSLNVSGNASLETKISFDNPVVCSGNVQYSMVFQTDSAVHSMHVADLGGRDVSSGAIVSQQPYLAGMLFSSKNALAWTANQSMNLKFKIYATQFNSSSTIDFTEITGLSADTLVLMCAQDTPLGTSVAWSVSLDGGTYVSIIPGEDTDLITSASRVKLRAVLSSSPNSNVSPTLDLNSIALMAFTTALSGSYIGRNVELATAMTDITQVYDANIPSGCTVVPQFSYDNGSTWVTPVQTNVESISAQYTRYTCHTTILSSLNAMNFRARLNVTSNSQTLRPIARRFVNIMK